MKRRLIFVMLITKKEFIKNVIAIQEEIMKLLNKIVTFFSAMNVTFGTFNH